jgi:hypothetical protein
MFTPASWKVTVPVGTGPTPLTVAVKVIDWPNTDGFTNDVTVVVDAAAATSTIPRRRTTTLIAAAQDMATVRERADLDPAGGSEDGLGLSMAGCGALMGVVCPNLA